MLGNITFFTLFGIATIFFVIVRKKLVSIFFNLISSPKKKERIFFEGFTCLFVWSGLSLMVNQLIWCLWPGAWLEAINDEAFFYDIMLVCSPLVVLFWAGCQFMDEYHCRQLSKYIKDAVDNHSEVRGAIGGKFEVPINRRKRREYKNFLCSPVKGKNGATGMDLLEWYFKNSKKQSETLHQLLLITGMTNTI